MEIRGGVKMNLNKLKRQEPRAIIQTLAFMSYNPSIGRILKRGGVKKFEQIALKEIPKIQRINNRMEFDRFHKGFVKALVSKLRTGKGRKLTYGQPQKPVNTFLKVYIDWASLPNRKTAGKLRQFLHCPLDSILMQAIKDEFEDTYEEKILPIYKKKYIQPSDLSLASIDEEVYSAWQELLKSIHPEKPILLDVLWSLGRRG